MLEAKAQEALVFWFIFNASKTRSSPENHVPSLAEPHREHRCQVAISCREHHASCVPGAHRLTTGHTAGSQAWHTSDDGGVGEQPCLGGPVGAALPREEPPELMISRTRGGRNAGCAERSAPWGSRGEPCVSGERKALGETGHPEPRHGAGLLSHGRVLILL